MRLVATDLDGTLLRPDGSLSERTARALGRCRAAGVGVVLVTGRPVRWMAAVAEAAGDRGAALCSNGAAVVDLSRLEVVRCRAFAHEDLLRTVSALAAVVDDARFGFECLDGPRWQTGFPSSEVLSPPPPTGSLGDLLAGRPTVLKVLCRSRSLGADEMLDRGRRVLAGLGEPVHSNPSGSLLEISAAGVSKASALADLAGERGIAAADVVAFGDMPNDAAMLRWAGTGYAMADGHPEAIAAADAAAPPSAQDGVAQILEALLDDLPAVRNRTPR